MDYLIIGTFLLVGTLIAFGAWGAERYRNQDKEPEARNYIARTFLILFLVVDGMIAIWIAWCIFSLSLAWEKYHSAITERPVTEQEIQKLTDRGLPNLPAGTIIAVDESGYQHQLRAPEGRTIPWGNLQLDGFNFDLNMPVLSINNPAIHAMGIKDVVCVDGEMPIYLAKPNAVATSLRFDDYRLDSCRVTGVTFKDFSPTLTLTAPRYQVKTVGLFQSRFLPKNVVARYEVNQDEEVITFYAPNQSKNTQIELKGVYTDEQNHILALKFWMGMYPQEETEQRATVENDSKIRIGNCDYEPYQTSILLTDFNQGKATWHFESDTREIAKECQTQVLPYHIEVGKVR